MIFNVAEDGFSPKHGSTWCDLFRDRASSLSGRRPPSWTTGTVEDFVLVEVDFSNNSSILAISQTFDAFFYRIKLSPYLSLNTCCSACNCQIERREL